MKDALTADLTPAEKMMGTKNVKKLVLMYSIPTVIGMLVNALYNVVDRFWAGQIPNVGSAPLTGIGLCMPIMNVMTGLSMLVGIGAASCISIKLGQKDKQGAEEILGNGLCLILIFAVLFTIFGLIYVEPVLRAVGATDVTLPFALSYIRIIIGGGFFSFVSFAMNHPIRATGNPKRFASTQIIGAVTNMILDPLFIMKFNMGIEGAAYATIIAQAVSAVWVMCYYFIDIKGRSPIRIKFKNMKLKLSVVLKIFSIGVSPFTIQVLASAVSIIVNQTLLYYGNIEFGDGNAAIGAMTVINSVSVLFIMPVFGINQGSQPIIGFNYGAGNFLRLKEAYKWSVIYSMIICTVGFFAIQMFSRQIVSLFNDDPVLVTIGGEGMRIMLFMLPIVGFMVPTSNFFQSIGRALISAALSLLRQFFVLIPAYLILPRIFGFLGIWYAMPLSDIVAMIVTVVLIVREFKILQKKILKNS